MSFLSQIYQQIKFDRDLVFQFFIEFGLFENALKQSGFSIGDSDDVRPDWDNTLGMLMVNLVFVIFLNLKSRRTIF